jgi:nitrous oxide reductase accessory protein NosL
MIKTLKILLILICIAASSSWAEEKKAFKPSPKEKCPVCGMFVAKYPDWVTAIRFRDGAVVFFDGAKDMFKYYFNLIKYNPSKKQMDIEALQVTDYYSLTPTNGFEAYYVIGSDVYGPMGRELIPFAKEEDAKEFMKDHKGQNMLRFKEVTAEKIKELDG